MAESAQYNGAIVAFEGPGDLVSTQIRLLPTSTQIALLPSVKEYLEPDNPEEPFEARKFVKRVHDAVAKRREVALAFLKDSTPTRKRLVFMNGGTPSAQTVCIRAISRNVVDGDIPKAEAIFNDIVKGGVASLTQHPATAGGSFLDTSDEFIEDPITRAMRAADALDRETENLQPSSDIDLTTTIIRPRSLSLPMFCFADTYGDTAPFYVFGGQYHEECGADEGRLRETAQLHDRMPSLAITNFDELERRSGGGFDREGNLTTPGPPRSPSCVGEAYDRGDISSPPSPNPSATLGMATPRSDVFSIRSTEPIFIEQASLVRMQSSDSPNSIKRSRSNGQLNRTSSRYRDTLVRLRNKNSLAEAVIADHPANGRPGSGPGLVEAVAQRESKAKVFEGPKTVYVGYPRTNNPRHSPMEELAWHHRRIKNRYVDKGSDAQDVGESEDASLPVLPFHEDLVIHFKDENPDPILEHIIKSFKEGSCPVAVPSGSSRATSVADDYSTAPDTPPMTTSELRAKASSPAIARGEYDPYSYDDTVLSRKHPLYAARSMTTSALPTPAYTPPPTMSETEDKFHDFNAVQGQTAVAMQNSLRSVLKIYFPPNGRGYSQFSFPLLPEMEALWKPVFRETDPDESFGKDSRRIDLILAVGAQRGVKKPFVSGVVSKLEKLGSKSNGICRTGRLDFRYLVANAMQSFTAQPLAKQTHDNPFSNSYFLATLIVPHLETFFAAHSEVRFLLLDYPPDHLVTVLALQKLIGVDLMKVAQVIDAEAKDPLPFTHVRGNSQGRVSPRSDFASGSGSVQSKDSKPAASTSTRDGLAVSKANLLLASTATDNEVATFVSTVRTILMTISRFYLPEKGSKNPGKLRTGNPSPVTQQTMSPPMSPISIRSKRHNRTTSSVKSSPRTSSLGDSIMVRRLKSRRGDKKSGLGDDGSIMTVDMEFESDLDLEERRLMPMFLKKNHTRKGNSRKALKFLGLA